MGVGMGVGVGVGGASESGRDSAEAPVHSADGEPDGRGDLGKPGPRRGAGPQQRVLVSVEVGDEPLEAAHELGGLDGVERIAGMRGRGVGGRPIAGRATRVAPQPIEGRGVDHAAEPGVEQLVRIHPRGRGAADDAEEGVLHGVEAEGFIAARERGDEPDGAVEPRAVESIEGGVVSPAQACGERVARRRLHSGPGARSRR